MLSDAQALFNLLSARGQILSDTTYRGTLV
jgi:hypothetical protein